MFHPFILHEQTFHLLCEKALFWEQKNWLIVADVHLGKSSHFRRNGFAVPKGVADKTLDSLASIIHKVKPAQVIFLGDLFHSAHNEEWVLLANLIDTFHEVDFVLIEGNHDILNAQLYTEAGIIVVPEIIEGPFRFSHHPEPDENYYNISGHVHPAVELRGKGRQSLKFPCFYFGQQLGILPAFGEFTGTHVLTVQEGDEVFVCAGGKVLRANI